MKLSHFIAALIGSAFLAAICGCSAEAIEAFRGILRPADNLTSQGGNGDTKNPGDLVVVSKYSNARQGRDRGRNSIEGFCDPGRRQARIGARRAFATERM